ncbi:hypothetical protein HZS_6389 [Henneguya salminicola]|nr:hypothetical protein HZS_6389 [Henneguya salminicola]
MLTDPVTYKYLSKGALAKYTISPDYSEQAAQNGVKSCLTCYCIKIPKSHHCRVCKRCIRKMDHHCPWFYIFCISFQVLCTIIPSLSLLVPDGKFGELYVEKYIYVQTSQILHTLLLLLESTIFCLFTLVMLSVQLYNIYTDQSTVGRFKLDTNFSTYGLYEF